MYELMASMCTMNVCGIVIIFCVFFVIDKMFVDFFSSLIQMPNVFLYIRLGNKIINKNYFLIFFFLRLLASTGK
jgi:hypothetical protein